jgi:hypothetical protein
MAEVTPLVIANRACAMFGNEPLQSLDEETLAGQRVQLIFDSLLLFCLGLTPWQFARQTVQLAMTAEPLGFSGYLNGYAHQFTIPRGFAVNPNRLLRSNDPDDVLLYFEREGDKVYSNDKTCFALIDAQNHPEQWNGMFAHAFTVALAGELAMALADDKNVSAAKKEEAFGPSSAEYRGGLMGAAIRADARNAPVRRLPQSNPLLDSWMS